MINIEDWLEELLSDIKAASDRNENFDLHMEAPYVKEVAESYDKVKWIEIY